jgi:intracellular sulfur oxidation DsrE/DsrF family protein
MNEEIKNKIQDFLKEISLDNCYFPDYVNVEDIDLDNAFDSIRDLIEDNNGFDVEIIYYSNAIEYLQKNDPSLRESLEIALEYGYTPDKLNSEILASLLASQNVRSEFQDLESEITTFFENIQDEIES